MNETLLRDLEDALPALQKFVGEQSVACGIILGSGLGEFAATLGNAQALPYSEVPHMKTSTAAGHVGQLVLGECCGKRVLCMQGRLHGYEGYSAAEVAFPVWLMARLGIKILISGNAAGAINPSYAVGDICLMKDHINLTARNPLTGVEPNKIAPRFVPMHDAYDEGLREMAKQVATENGISVQEGVYLGFAGPSFETPAEIRAFSVLGADTVAMSVIEEVIAARHCGMRVLGFSLVTNMAAGISGGAPTDEEVLDVGKACLEDVKALLEGVIARL